jgi:hypothetical protein
MLQTSYDAKLDPEEDIAILDCGCILQWDTDDPSGVTLTFCTHHRNVEIPLDGSSKQE